ncbi:MAG: Gfo/Idh/MocA family oxidoreductase [Solirubrobacterales bacterium]|nr:Gfo/Idh/MocA family oxidoreductase [Solirubrobacterales bacterium]
MVGLGYWGPNRLRALGDIDGMEVTWVCDRDPERNARVCKRYPGIRATTEIDEALADPELDAVVIATPVSSHHPLASAALRAGKHVFVEKPLAGSSSEANDLYEIAAEHERVLICGHTFLYSPPVRLIKEILDRGELGDLHFISSSRTNLGQYRSDVSVIFDLGPHDFSILLYWLGQVPERVSAVGSRVISKGVQDVAFVDLVFPDGMIAHVEMSWLAPSKLRRTVIVGSEKMLVYEDGTPEPVRIFDSGIEFEDTETFGEYQLSYRMGDIVSLRVAPTEPIVAELIDFRDAITKGTEPVSDKKMSLDVIRIVEAAEASLSGDGLFVPVAGAALPDVAGELL